MDKSITKNAPSEHPVLACQFLVTIYLIPIDDIEGFFRPVVLCLSPEQQEALAASFPHRCRLNEVLLRPTLLCNGEHPMKPMTAALSGSNRTIGYPA